MNSTIPNSIDSQRGNVIRVLAVSTSIVLLGLAVLVVASPQFRQIAFNSQVREVWLSCNTFFDEGACYQTRAIEAQNPDICWLLGAAIDDWCMQQVYENSQNPSICEQVPKAGVIVQCEEYFSSGR